jgi:hypothetical protein
MSEFNFLMPKKNNYNSFASNLTQQPLTTLEQAKQLYPFINQHNPVLVENPIEGRGYAETWPIGETGAQDYPRPKHFPLHQVGIEVYKPDQFSAHDIAGEMLHVDKLANMYRTKFKSTLTPEQTAELMQQPDYEMSVKQGQSPEQALQNSADAAIRGYAVGQWPKKEVERFFTSAQKTLLSGLKDYMKTGKGK